jgi:predicted  nucleic acid-binding Zn-ribbon protein
MLRRTRAVALCIVLLACNRERRQIEERVAILDEQRVMLERTVSDRRNRVAEATRRADALKADLAAYNTELHDFLANHRVAAECIRTSRSAWGEGHSFSGDGSRLTKVGAALCSVALISNEFAAEVARVTEKVDEAGAHVKDLEAQINAAERTLETERAAVREKESELDAITAEITVLRRRLER